MKKLTWILTLTLCLALLLTACGSQPAPTPTPDPDPVTEPIDEPDNEVDLAQKYFDYFYSHMNSGDAFMLYCGGAKENSADNLAAYVLMKLAGETIADGAPPSYSYPKAEFDRAALEYLGEAFTRYETALTTVTPEGNVTTTGWGYSPCNYVLLQSREQLGENHYKGTFTAYPTPDNSQSGDYNDYAARRQRMLEGNILPSDGDPVTITMEWEEWESPQLGTQLRYLSVQADHAVTVAVPVDETTPIDPDVQKYFEYFYTNTTEVFALPPYGTEKEKAADRAAYILCKLIAEQYAAGVTDTAAGFTKEEFDRAAMEYLGEPLTTYETIKTTVTPDGMVTSTGWGMIIPNFMVLTHLEQLGENHYKGTFNSYANGYGQGGDTVEPPENCCRRLMQGNILPTDRLQGVYTLEWEEWESPLLGLQLRYLSCEFTPAN